MTTNATHGTRSRAWCFTTNIDAGIHWLTDPQLTLRLQDQGTQLASTYFCVGREIAPTTGQRHYQGYIYFKSQRHFGPVRNILSNLFDGIIPHVEPARGSPRQNRDYCRKSSVPIAMLDGDIPKFFEIGELPRQGGRTDLQEIAKAVTQGTTISNIAHEFPSEFIKYSHGIKQFHAIVSSKPRDITVVPVVSWWFGRTGVGKSRRAFELYGTDAYIKMTDKWWDGYSGQKVVIFDDYRASLCPFHELLRILDRYPYRVQFKGGSIELSASVFVITTPHRPEVTWSNRTQESIAQLLRRITEIVEFLENGETRILKDSSTPYVPILPDQNSSFHPLDEFA